MHQNLYVGFGPTEDPVHALVVAHLDTAPFSPGAQDNASGCAILLALARLLAAVPLPRHVRLLWTVGEETDFFGAFTHVTLHREKLQRCQLVLNIDPLCSKGSAETAALVLGDAGWRAWLECLGGRLTYPMSIHPIEAPKEGSGTPAIELNSDLVAFATNGLPGVLLFRGSNARGCHTPDETPDKVAFRIHKNDLRVRPIWHQRQDRVRAHILVCFPAYVLWKTLAQMCRRGGLGQEPRRVLEELSKIKVVDVILPTRPACAEHADRRAREIRRRCVTQPSEHQSILLQRLGLHLPKTIEMTEM